jgi:hypothetical protein
MIICSNVSMLLIIGERMLPGEAFFSNKISEGKNSIEEGTFKPF